MSHKRTLPQRIQRALHYQAAELARGDVGASRRESTRLVRNLYPLAVQKVAEIRALDIRTPDQDAELADLVHLLATR